MKNYKGLIIFLVIVVILLVIPIGMYNSLVSVDEKVDEKWADVNSQLQRRFDLIPNLVETVKGYADYEEETLTAVVEARNKFTTASTVEDVAQADSQLQTALRQLSVVVERYPELKANQSFLDLQTQLEGTENRISVARIDYNKAVKNLNSKIRRFPNSILARLFNFEKREYFEATEGAEQVPSVKF